MGEAPPPLADDGVLQGFEKGGPNDPTVTFEALRKQLAQCKEEFSPWGWQDYIVEFTDRMDAEMRLRALNALPGSGEEVKDGVVQGTPVWQERLDKILLVEHLKKKIMQSHTVMTEANDLLLKANAWLVKNSDLADSFSYYIRHVPPSQYDKLDLLRLKLEKKRKEVKEAREHHEDYLITQYRQRDAFLKKTLAHLNVSSNMRLKDDVFLSWSFTTNSIQLKSSRHAKACLELRCTRLETGYAALAEELEESRRVFKEELDAMTADRDKFKKLYNRMVEAHERAKRDLEATKGTVEGMQQMITVLSSEKTLLEKKVLDLEEEIQKLLKQIEELRELVSRLREEIRRECQLMKGTELALLDARKEIARQEDIASELEAKVDRAVDTEVRLRDDIDTLQIEVTAALAQVAPYAEKLETEEALRHTIEEERDRAVDMALRNEEELIKMVERCTAQIWATQEKARRDLNEFKEVELDKVKTEFKRKTDIILRRNEMLEREVAIGDELAPHMNVLNPLQVDASKICAICRRILVYDGTLQL
mmetsp:Transcript_115663/g.327029  ORF Transcript_115663/g.327029 Transcript_115663/m.327029 type:complete len:536 (+) Transcript_115663:88-1695(+)